MNYKEKYRESLERAKAWCDCEHATTDDKILLKRIFPELKESEDEESKKWILEYLYDGLRKSDEQFKGQFKAAIAWLEGEHKSGCGITDATKQELKDNLNKDLQKETGESWNKFLDEQNPNDKVEPKFKVGDKVYAFRNRFECTIESIDETTYYGDTTNFDIKDQDNWKLVEQKPDDKVKPKFKEGDWIITNKKHIWYVDETPETTSYLYRLINQYGKVEVAEFEVVDEKATLWTIQDAKKGDVLATKTGGIFIYKELLYDKPFAYCGVDKFGVFKDCNCGDGLDWTPYLSDVTPATKEQRDQLEKAMTDAGYTFDFEKKELKKIEQKQVIDYQDSLPKDNWELIREFITKFGRIPKDEDELNVLVEYVLKRQKPTWSEEDEKNLRVIVDYLIADNGLTLKYINWIKYLKDRYTWKPSDEQLKSLQEVIDAGYFTSYPSAIETLYKQLKQLWE